MDTVAATARGALAAWAYPLVGVVVGGLGAVTGALALWLGLPAPLAAGLVLLAMIAVTGALHEDGLADTADGFWGGWDRARRLEIMKDSQIGSYGVIALILSLGLRWSALGVLIAHGTPTPADPCRRNPVARADGGGDVGPAQCPRHRPVRAGRPAGHDYRPCWPSRSRWPAAWS